MPIEKIIVLEDDLVVRKSLEQQLRYKRYDVASASTIAEAEELLTKDNFDLMIVDVRLPDGKGTDLLKQLQSDDSGNPLSQSRPRQIASLLLGSPEFQRR